MVNELINIYIYIYLHEKIMNKHDGFEMNTPTNKHELILPQQ